MTEEQKELLLKDLCGRLPYGVKIQTDYTDIKILEGIQFPNYIGISDGYYSLDDVECKPYLFPMSSMTEEQRKEYDSIIYHNIELHADRYYEVIDVDSFELLQDFYHKNHLDYRGLIEKSLALDATNLGI